MQDSIANQAAGDEESVRAEVDSLRAKIEIMTAREERLMNAMGAATPERLEHDLRNLLNELNLLRVLFDQQEK